MIIKALIPKEILNIIKKFNINFKPIDEEILLKEIYITFSDALVEMTNVEMIEEVNFWLSSFLETGEIVKVVDEDKKKLLVSSLFLPQVIETQQ